MARINLSIPDGIKQEMDGIQGVNWSSVAAEAFQDVVARNKHRGDSMSEIKERLMASKAKFEKDMIETGETYGRDWAKDDAEYVELLKLQKQERYPETLEELFCHIADEPTDNYAYRDFLETIFGHTWEHDSQKYDVAPFCKGFVEGALALFDEAMAA